MQVAMQVADVNKTLGSAFRMNQCGIKIVLDGVKSYFLDTKTGKVTKINVENGQYTFNIWVKADDKEKDMEEAVNETIVKKGNRFATIKKDDEVKNVTDDVMMKVNTLFDDVTMDFIRREVRARRASGNL